jgi:hypothetical protein
MRDRRILIAGDLAAFLLFFLVGVASHEREIGPAIFARSFLPFAAAWLTLGTLLGAYRAERPSLRLLAVYLACGVVALVARAIIFDRSLFNAFFVIALAGNGLMLFAWRWRAPVLAEKNLAPGATARGRRSLAAAVGRTDDLARPQADADGVLAGACVRHNGGPGPPPGIAPPGGGGLPPKTRGRSRLCPGP